MVQYNNNIQKLDNSIIINGTEVRLTDEETLKIIDIVNGIVNSRNSISTPISTPTCGVRLVEEDSESSALVPKDSKYAPILGDVKYEDDCVTCTQYEYTDNGKTVKQYRLYITCKIGGEKGKKIRYAIKANAKQNFGVKFGGNADENDFFWTFPTAKSANEFVKARKAYNASKESK